MYIGKPPIVADSCPNDLVRNVNEREYHTRRAEKSTPTRFTPIRTTPVMSFSQKKEDGVQTDMAPFNDAGRGSNKRHPNDKIA